MSLPGTGIECDDDISSQTVFEKFKLVTSARGSRNAGIECWRILSIVLHQGISLDGIGLSSLDCGKQVTNVEAEEQEVWRGGLGWCHKTIDIVSAYSGTMSKSVAGSQD